ncbi:MAG TPA: sugar transferase [Longimicrobium sp.]|nr:sugar transferase [Longimicrobium sp.]
MGTLRSNYVERGTSSAVLTPVGERRAGDRRMGDRRMPPEMAPYDVRLRREITHRRLAISLLRRFVRVVSLHLVDATLVGLSLLLVAWMLGSWSVASPFLPVVVASFLLSLNALGAYGPGEARRNRRRLASSVGLAILLLGCLVAFPPSIPLPGRLLAGVAVVGFVALAAGRKCADMAMRQAYARGLGLRNTLVVGSLDEVGNAIREIRDHHSVDQYVVGHLTAADHADPTSLGMVGDLERVLDELDVQEVLVAATLANEEVLRVAGACFERGVALYVIPPLMGGADFYAEPRQMGDCAMMRLHPARLEMPGLLVKRAADMVLASLALLLLSPVMALIALAIKMESPGAVFFRQERVGLGGRLFTIWKFRSMTTDAEARLADLAHLNIYGEQALFKLVNDPRITRVGSFLRRTSLDELPQLMNVLLGDMSLVGPRPLPLSDVDRFEPHHFERLSVVPGITGPWQVSGRNMITDFDEILKMERRYITEWSLLVDAKIMVRTLVVVVRGDGAY